jgi:hypothetical protein
MPAPKKPRDLNNAFMTVRTVSPALVTEARLKLSFDLTLVGDRERLRTFATRLLALADYHTPPTRKT